MMSPPRKVKGDGEVVCEPRAKSLRNAAGRLEEDVEREGTRSSRGFSGKQWRGTGCGANTDSSHEVYEVGETATTRKAREAGLSGQEGAEKL